MPVIAVTGHMDLTASTSTLVRTELATILGKYSPKELVGLSCLARGADTLFAQAVLDAGGTLVVVLPSRDYRVRKVKLDHLPVFDRILDKAQVEVMPFETASREAYEAANNFLLERATELIAIWDGEESAGIGGTADVVVHARRLGIPTTVVWPDGAARG